MRLVVTGAHGFIGQYVCAEATKRGHELLEFDRSVGLDTTSEEDIKFMEGYDAVIHLAGVLGTEELFNDPNHAVTINIGGSLGVLRACQRYGIHYVGITMPDVWPNLYQATKKCALEFAEAYRFNYHVPVSHVRAYNAFGPGQKWYGVQKIIPTFSMKAWRNDPIPVWGDGTQSVDLVYVKDIARMMVEVAEGSIEGKYGQGQVFDAGTGARWSVNGVVNFVLKHTFSRSRIDHLPMRKGELPSTQIVAEGLGWSELGWKPELRMEELIRTINWYKDKEPRA